MAAERHRISAKVWLAGLVWLAVLLMVPYAASIAQDKEAVKQQAEQQLKTMTPDQIDAKIKEYGMTREEAEAKARALGINLEQYLGGQSKLQQSQEPAQGGEAAAPPSVADTTLQQAAPPPTTTAIPAPAPTYYPVPGFENRDVADKLPAFGYDLFNYPSSTFQPVQNLPTPVDYQVGPGDELVLTIWGETQLYSTLVVNREGQVIIPDVGPVSVQGLTIARVKERLLQRLTSVYSGLKNGGAGANTWLDVSLGRIRSIQVFVLGEVAKPGGYSVSSMSTAMLALYVAGGPTLLGTLRNVQVVRGDKVISTIDFYDFALRGDKSKDVRLQDGDVVFVKPAGRRAAISGAILRPGIYELKKGENLSDLISLAGGLQFISYVNRVHIERVIPFDERKNYVKDILDIDVPFSNVGQLQKSRQTLEDGDLVSILRISDFKENRVSVGGNVVKPGIFALTDSMRVKDIIEEADGVLSNTFMERADIIRILPDLHTEIVSFNLDKALAGDTASNVLLQPDDSLVVYTLQYFFPEHNVRIAGAVKNPGRFLRAENMTVQDLLVLAGGLTDDADGTHLTVSRIDTVSEATFSRVYTIEMPRDYWESAWKDTFYLKDFDYVFVPSNPTYNRPQYVTLTGEVRYPGTYVISYRGERLSSAVERAGGLKPTAYLEGSRLYRSFENAGLVGVDFRDALDDPTGHSNIELAPGDSISFPKNPKVVYVRGEVQVPSAVVYRKGESLDYYLNQAGGLTQAGDDGRIVVTLPNGQKWKHGWFFFPNPDILAGTTIYVPAVVEKPDNTLEILRDWATIVASLAAITVAVARL